MKKRPGGLAYIRVFVVFCVVAALTGCYSLKVDMTPYAAPASCGIAVTDQRPDVSAISGSQVTFAINPPLAEVLRSKLCQSPAVSAFAARNTTVVRITHAELTVFGFVGSTKMLTIEGTMAADFRKWTMAGRGTVDTASPEGYWSTIMNAALDDFVKQVENYLPRQQ